jgi:hypothetical protein
MTSWQGSKDGSDWSHDGSRCSHDYCSGRHNTSRSCRVHAQAAGQWPGCHHHTRQIEADDHKKFIEIASDAMQASIILNSKGGHLGSAIIIGRFIRLRNYEARVHNGAVCNSACTLIWLAGTFRHLDRRARLGFHSGAMSPRPPYKRSEPGNAMMAAYMAGWRRRRVLGSGVLVRGVVG